MQPEDAVACRNLGRMYNLKNDTAKAVAYFERAVTLDPGDHESHAALRDIFSARGDIRRIVLHAMWAVLGAPGHVPHKKIFIALAGGVPFTAYSAPAEKALLACLETPDVDCQPAQRMWHSLFSLNPAFAKIYGKNMPEVFNAEDIEMLSRPFLLLALRRIVVANKEFEGFVTTLRRSLLMSDMPAPAATVMAAAIACYAHNAEYIMDVTAEEEKKVESLRARVSQNPVPHDVALLACYAGLFGMPDAGGMLAAAESLGIAGSHIHEPGRLASLRGNIAQITPIHAGVSEKVRAQYEIFPYPRWKNLREGELALRSMKILETDPVNILVAGCGTGKEALTLASRMPQSRFLAVDLSTASLSYAIHKAEQLGIRNVTFRQGDILLLGSLKEKYDYISCGGVLHHMEDPLEGWRVLEGLLLPGGVMSIALYSRLARADVYAARAAIALAGIADDAAGIRDFRRRCADLLPPEMAEKLTARKDYYYMSMCRDLIFHVQEHGFDVPRIEACLKELGLSFMGFRLPLHVSLGFARKKISLPADRDLAAWDRFEAEHPDMFSGMYQFWCKKPE